MIPWETVDCKLTGRTRLRTGNDHVGWFTWVEVLIVQVEEQYTRQPMDQPDQGRVKTRWRDLQVSDLALLSNIGELRGPS